MVRERVDSGSEMLVYLRIDQGRLHTDAEKVPHEIVGLHRHEDQYLALNSCLSDLTGCVQRIGSGQRDVQNRDAPGYVHRKLNGLAAIISLRADTPVALLFQQLPQVLPRNVVGMSQED